MSHGFGFGPDRRVEMGISHADFYRIFPRLVAPERPQYDGLCTRVAWPSGSRLQLRMSVEKARRIAGLTLPYVDIELDFAGFTAQGERDFIERFLNAFHRGGG